MASWISMSFVCCSKNFVAGTNHRSSLGTILIPHRPDVEYLWEHAISGELFQAQGKENMLKCTALEAFVLSDHARKATLDLPAAVVLWFVAFFFSVADALIDGCVGTNCRKKPSRKIK